MGAELARDEGSTVYGKTALSFIASKLGSHKARSHTGFCVDSNSGVIELLAALLLHQLSLIHI